MPEENQQDELPTTEKGQKAHKEEPAKKPLDLASLDLSVEKVEERISPSETNVFDK